MTTYLTWWVEHGVAALKNNAGAHHHEWSDCPAGRATDADPTVKAMRTGLLQFSQGCFAAIRNPATHGTTEMAPHLAMEQLAILSTLSRWIDQCDLLAVETP
ncbi:TIGR02391 family protein [Mycobacterium sp. NBC_00419]|uniref:TIGR02391 family protein n=1 Tax=Mycobacterium sp. NBC_00419 TaxID=2975989 RepID=UPI003FA5DAEF